MDAHQVNFSDYHLGINDKRVRILVFEMGMEGYGIYISLIDFLLGSDNRKLPFSLLPFLSKILPCQLEKLEKVIRTYELFDLDGDSFSLLNYKPL